MPVRVLLSRSDAQMKQRKVSDSQVSGFDWQPCLLCPKERVSKDLFPAEERHAVLLWARCDATVAVCGAGVIVS